MYVGTASSKRVSGDGGFGNAERENEGWRSGFEQGRWYQRRQDRSGMIFMHQGAITLELEVVELKYSGFRWDLESEIEV